MVKIIGVNDVSQKFLEAAQAAGISAEVVGQDCSCKDCELIVLNTNHELSVLRGEVCKLTEYTDTPIAVVVDTEYVCAVARDAVDKSRVVGLRVMDGEHIGEYIELTGTFDTDERIYQNVRALLRRFNTNVVEVPDIMGGIFYRIFPLQANMGAFLVTEGVTVEDVDNSMRYGANIKRQPLRMADEIGIDRLLEVLEAIYKETGRPAYRPCPLLKKMVNAGRLGKKSGYGFYKYD